MLVYLQNAYFIQTRYSIHLLYFKGDLDKANGEYFQPVPSVSLSLPSTHYSMQSCSFFLMVCFPSIILAGSQPQFNYTDIFPNIRWPKGVNLHLLHQIDHSPCILHSLKSSCPADSLSTCNIQMIGHLTYA